MPKPYRYLLAIILLLATPGIAVGRPAHRGFNLFDTPGFALLQGNRVTCYLNGIGELCVDPTNSPVLGGGFWPAGTVDQYVFNQGLQVVGLIAGADLPNFPWPGDTAGAFFFDPRGDQAHGTALIEPLSSTDIRGRLQWPSVAGANDPALYAPPILGHAFIADQDVFTRFWDGNTALTSGRQHPMGLLVDLRAMAWNNDGLRDIVFFVYHIINISARSSAPYQRLAAAGYDAEAIAEVARIGGQFQDGSERKFNVQIPDSGYSMLDMYLGFAQDADVGQAGSNYSNASQVFQATFAYKADFREQNWSYPPDIFGSPFAAAPGFVSEAVIRTPPDTTAGRPPAIMWMTSNTTGGAPFPDAVGVQRLWRNLSLNLLPTDGTCAVPNPKVRHFCYHTSSAVDTRVMLSTGPTRLDPGQSALLIVAQVNAAPVDSAVRPFIGLDLKPGLPMNGTRLVQGLDTVRNVDRVAGWQSYSDLDGNGSIEANEVVTRPRSLYGKIQVARAMADAGFLQPAAPRAPQSFVVPDDGRVTVVWQKSADEQTGDPYFQVASNPASRLYDPSFRRFDVEGYRVWRGTSPTNMQVVAQYDYAGTRITDYAGQVFTDQAGVRSCVPELGVTTGCPAFPRSLPLTGPIYQYRLGDRGQLLSGDVVTFAADTAVTGGGSGRAQLSDKLVPFVYIDSGLQNGRTYYYGVTAFDVNSIRSGPSTMESQLVPHSVTPRVPASAQVPGAATVALIGRSGNPLPAGTLPTLGASSAIFSGPMPPANGLTVGFLQFIPNLVDDGSTVVTVDSVVPGSWFNGAAPAVYWFTAQGNIAPQKFSVSILGQATSNATDITATATFPAAALNQSSSAPVGGDSTFALTGYATVAVNGDYRYTNQYRAAINGDPGAGTSEGPRWWVGNSNENVADPNGINCLVPPLSFSCALADLSRNAGVITGVGIFNIASYGTIGTTEPVRTLEGVTSSVFRAADFKWYWGANGLVDSVVDVVHDVRVPFSPKIRASWGIVNDSSFLGHVVLKDSLPDTSVTRLTWGDIACVAPGPRFLRGLGSRQSCGGAGNFTGSDSGAVLQNHARLSPVNFTSSTFPNLMILSAAAPTGNGFILYLDGHFFLMQMPSLPPAGTVWNMRTYAGNITGAAGAYQYVPATRPAAVPGLRVQMSYTGSTPDSSISLASQLATVHTVPDPYYLGNSLETAGRQVLRFVNLPSQAIIRIYSSSGQLVQLLQHNDPSGGGEASWDLRSRGGRDVASGVYFYHVEAPDGATRVGRFVIINTR